MNLNSLSRRRLLKVSGASLLASAVWPGSLYAGQTATKNYKFIQINDLHFTDDQCGKYFEALVKQLNATKDIDFVLLAGDLSENGLPEQLNPFRDIFKNLNTPYHVVVGNHDHNKETDIKTYDAVYPKSHNYTFDHNGYQIIALDTSDGQKADNVNCSKDTLDWIDATLPTIKKDVPIILVTHFPLGSLTPMRVKNADDVLNRFKETNLQAIFNGHFHGYTERTFQNASITTNCCCSYRRDNHDHTTRKGYFLCSANEGKVSREFVEFKQPDWHASTQPSSTTQPVQ